jgi:hypothetical protein
MEKFIMKNDKIFDQHNERMEEIAKMTSGISDETKEMINNAMNPMTDFIKQHNERMKEIINENNIDITKMSVPKIKKR